MADIRLNASLVISRSSPLYLGGSNLERTETVEIPLYAGGLYHDTRMLPSGATRLYTGYPDSQQQLVCLGQDSDDPRLALGAMPAAAALAMLSATDGGSTVVKLRWSLLVERSAGLSTTCQAAYQQQLANESSSLLAGWLASAYLGPATGSQDLQMPLASPTGVGSLPLFWRLSGSQSCSVDVGYGGGTPGTALIGQNSRKGNVQGYWSACNATVASGSHAVALTCDWGKSVAGRPFAPQSSVLPCPAGLQGPTVAVVMDQVQGGLLGERLGSLSISGLYLGFVLAIGRLLRSTFGNLREKIPYDELPSTGKLLQLVSDIHMARSQGDLVLVRGHLTGSKQDPTHMLLTAARSHRRSGCTGR